VPRFAVVVTLALIAACGSGAPTNTPADSSLLVVRPGVLISADSDASGDAYSISGRPAVERNFLHVTVQYGGGCARHEFALRASHVFLESNPVQSPITIRHKANGDPCRALLTRDLRFDLTALRDAWRRSYQRQSGTIILRLRGYDEGITYTF
jgi:hypothetical protein